LKNNHNSNSTPPNDMTCSWMKFIHWLASMESTRSSQYYIVEMLHRLKSMSFSTKIVATLALGSQPRQGVARLRAKRGTRESHHMFSRVWGNNPHPPKWTPIVGIGVPNGLPNLQNVIVGVKTHRLEKFFISLKNYWNVYV
jgi:hypothetical protein